MDNILIWTSYHRICRRKDFPLSQRSFYWFMARCCAWQHKKTLSPWAWKPLKCDQFVLPEYWLGMYIYLDHCVITYTIPSLDQSRPLYCLVAEILAAWFTYKPLSLSLKSGDMAGIETWGRLLNSLWSWQQNGTPSCLVIKETSGKNSLCPKSLAVGSVVWKLQYSRQLTYTCTESTWNTSVLTFVSSQTLPATYGSYMCIPVN